MTVLVGYASRNGSTREIAERIAAGIAARGLPVEVRPLGEVQDAGGYDRFVVGSAVYGGAWLPEAVCFTRANLDLLGQRPTWLFSVGIRGTQHGLLGRLLGRAEPGEVDRLRARLRPAGYHAFAGVLRPAALPAPGRLAWRLLGGRYGDFRDLAEIDGWAAAIAAEIAAPAP